MHLLLCKRQVASVDIARGEEITFSYLGDDILCGKRALRQGILLDVWDFRCSCPACVTPVLGASLCEVKELQAFAFDRTPVRDAVDHHLRAGEQLLSLYGPLRKSPLTYAQTYLFLFRMAIMRRCTLGKARSYVIAAFREMSLVYDKISQPELNMLELSMDHPGSGVEARRRGRSGRA